MTGILCPRCGETDSRILDSRPGPNTTRRRRRCVCGNRWSTLEILDVEGGLIDISMLSIRDRGLIATILRRMLDHG